MRYHQRAAAATFVLAGLSDARPTPQFSFPSIDLGGFFSKFPRPTGGLGDRPEFSFPSFPGLPTSLPTGGLGSGPGISFPSPGGSLPIPTGGLGSGTGDSALPSFSFPTGADVVPSGIFGPPTGVAEVPSSAVQVTATPVVGDNATQPVPTGGTGSGETDCKPQSSAIFGGVMTAFSTIVEQADRCEIVVPPGIVLPGEVCSFSTGKILEHVSLSAKYPDNLASTTINVGD